MAYHKITLGSKSFFSLVIFTTLIENSIWTVFAVNGDWGFESTVEETENHLSYASTHHGIYDLQVREDDGWQMVQKQGNQFVVNDQPFYVNGFNTYWLMVFAADQSTRGKVSELFHQASSAGLTVCRTWAFNDGQWRALQTSPSVYDEEVFQALDFVVSEAKKYRIRLILSLTNNWDAYGGKAQYVKWGKAAGLNLTSDDEFFSHPTLKSYYKAHVKTVLNRVNTFTNVTYKNDPTIFAWELMNEPRCTSDPSGDTLQSWIQEMAVYVKSLDAKHLVEIGLEGFYGPSAPDRAKFNPNSDATQVGTDFIRNHQTLGVDFASVHIYADSWISQTISDAHLQFTKSWMEAHIEDAEKYLRMPVLFTEFGVSAKDTGYNTSFRDTLISSVYKTLLNSTRKGGSGAGSLLWQLFPDGTDYMNDGFYEEIQADHALQRLECITKAKVMNLSGGTMHGLRSCADENLFPVFSNLTRLQVDVGESEGRLLSTILKCSPNLEVLDINICYGEEVVWIEPRCVPHCLLSHVKRIKSCGCDVEKELAMIKYLLKNSIILETITIKLRSHRLWWINACQEKRPNYQKILMFERGSKTCQVEILDP